MNRCTHRSVSFVEKVELEFQGNHFCQALCLGDVDGDGLNEFIIGSVDGTLAIYKGNGSKHPWRIAKDLGTITCTGTGDIFNTNKMQLVCVNAAGICYIFSVYRFVSPRKGNSTSSSSSVSDTKPATGIKEIQWQYHQELHPNIKVILIGNIAPDGKEELFVGRTDRVVNVYRWSNDQRALVPKREFTFDGQIGSLSVSMTAEGTAQLLVSQTGGTYVPLWYQNIANEDQVTDLQENRPRNGSNISCDSEGLQLKMDNDKESIVSMSISGEETGKPPKQGSTSTIGVDGMGSGEPMRRNSSKKSVRDGVSSDYYQQQPFGPTPVTSSHTLPSCNSTTSMKTQHSIAATSTTTGIMDDYHLNAGPIVGLVQRMNPLSSTEIVGDLKSRGDLQEDTKHSNIVALCTLDGVIRFLKDEEKVWEHQVDHNLFSISKLDVTSNGQDEIVVCAWNGTTYILDHSRNVVRYKFGDNVCAFTAGYFGFGSSVHNKPCLIYTTFSNKIHIYHNITMASIPPSNLFTYLHEEEAPDRLKTKLSTLNDSEKADMIRRLLYKESF